MQKVKITLCMFLICSIMFLNSCNVLKPVDKTIGGDYEASQESELAQTALDKGDFTAAESKYKTLLEQQPDDPTTNLNYAKSVLGKNGFNIVDVVKTVSNLTDTNASAGVDEAMKLLPQFTTTTEANAVIASLEKATQTGAEYADDKNAKLALGVAYASRAVSSVKTTWDSNGDGTIDTNDQPADFSQSTYQQQATDLLTVVDDLDKSVTNLQGALIRTGETESSDDIYTDMKSAVTEVKSTLQEIANGSTTTWVDWSK